MRLHFVLPQLEPLYGMERAAVLLMRGLIAEGAEVSATVFSRGIPAGLEDLTLDHLNVGVRITRLAEAVTPLRRRLRALPADTEIISSGLWAHVPVSLALAGSGRTFVAWEHSVLPERIRIDRRVRMLARMTRLGPLRPRLVVAVSEGVADTVRQLQPGQAVTKISNVIDVGPFVPPRPRSGNGGIHLLTTGAFRPYKNYSCALTAMTLLPNHFTMDLAGDGEQGEMLRAKARELGLEGRVTFLGRVSDVRRRLREADVLVHPSRAETFGFSLIEAADAGVPVATLPALALNELIPTFVPGVRADDMTPAALARAIVRSVEQDRAGHTDFESAWRARSAAFAPAEVSRQWLKALSR